MKKVHFLTDKNPIVHYLTTPVRYNKKQLRERGFRVGFFYKPTEACLSCDILCLISKPTINLLEEKSAVFAESGPVISFIKKSRKCANKIIWMDSSDSTGVTHFELLPYIDLYLKKHLLKDKGLYQKEFYGGRIFTDYYYKKFGIVDSSPFKQFYPLDMKFVHKVNLSWNMGMGDVYNAFSKRNYISRLLPGILPSGYKVNFVDPKRKRKYDLFLRTTSDMGRETISFQRQELIRRLDKMLQAHDGLTGSVKGRVPLKVYREMVKSSKLSFGPFGWGELNVKEYEAHIFGALLIRPDISHMETWPSFWVEGETYQPFSWGFEDLEQVVMNSLKDEKERIRIACNGQEAFRDSISDKGMERFCNWFVKQIEL